MSSSRRRQGFSLLEIIVAMAIVGGLFVLGANTLFAPQRTNTLEVTIDTLLAELSNQQNKSMNSDTGVGTAKSSYGVYFTATGYTTFQGSSYSAGNSTNFTTTINENLRFSLIDLPGSQLIFATGSGALANYSASQTTVVIQDAVGGLTKTLTVNQHGVVESVQ